MSRTKKSNVSLHLQDEEESDTPTQVHRGEGLVEDSSESSQEQPRKRARKATSSKTAISLKIPKKGRSKTNPDLVASKFFNQGNFDLFSEYVKSNRALVTSEKIDWEFFSGSTLPMEFITHQHLETFVKISGPTYKEYVYMFYSNLTSSETKARDGTMVPCFQTMARGTAISFGAVELKNF